MGEKDMYPPMLTRTLGIMDGSSNWMILGGTARNGVVNRVLRSCCPENPWEVEDVGLSTTLRAVVVSLQRHSKGLGISTLHLFYLTRLHDSQSTPTHRQEYETIISKQNIYKCASFRFPLPLLIFTPDFSTLPDHLRSTHLSL
jgi:hypothetical protein